ncbi:unnamed protein product [[Candida] boidinii]|nr:unnamed protein product [[Candida] boidinii]
MTSTFKDDDPIMYNQPIVIDNGSGVIKAGFAGEDKPACYCSSIVGRPKYSKVMAGGLSEDDNYIGNRAQMNRGLLKLNYPISNGIVRDWDDMEMVWKHVINSELNVSNIEDHPILLTEAPLNPKTNREKAGEILFEKFNVPALYLSIQAVLSLYASGRTTGCVLDSGDGVTHVVPVYEGFSLLSSIKRIDIGGRDITEYLSMLLRRSGYGLTSSSEMEIVRNIKERLCYVSTNLTRDEDDARIEYSSRRNNVLNSTSGTGSNLMSLSTSSTTASSSSTSPNIYENYRLPDGKILNIGTERFTSCEILFRPDIIGLESEGIHEMLNNSILKTDIELRPILYQNIILSGGTTTLRNFGDRLLKETKFLVNGPASSSSYNTKSGTTNEASSAMKDANMTSQTKIKIFAPPERKFSTWIGGSILANLSSFKKMWISKNDYLENPDILHIKCL